MKFNELEIGQRFTKPGFPNSVYVKHADGYVKKPGRMPFRVWHNFEVELHPKPVEEVTK